MHIIAIAPTREFAKTLSKDDVLVTPDNFKAIDWRGVRVKGVKYYVDKAVKLGAINAEPKPKTSKKPSEEV